MDKETTDIVLILFIIMLIVSTIAWTVVFGVLYLRKKKKQSFFSEGRDDSEKKLGSFYGAVQSINKKTQTKEARTRDSGTDPAVELFMRPYKVPQKSIDPDSYPDFILAKVPPYLQGEDPNEISQTETSLKSAASKSGDSSKNMKRKVVRLNKPRSRGGPTITAIASREGGSSYDAINSSTASEQLNSTSNADTTREGDSTFTM